MCPLGTRFLSPPWTPGCAAQPRRVLEGKQAGRGFTAARRRASRLAGLSRSTWINLQPTNQTLLSFSAKCASSKICPRIARAKSTMMILKIVKHVSKRYPNAVQPACRPRALRAHSAQSGVKGHCPLREPRGIPPSGGISAASILSLDASRALWARCGVQGGERKRVPGGHNRRRRLATGSRQPKRGFGTAVPKTMIEVADHCPCYLANS